MISPMGDAHSVSDSTPLQFFARAKKEINDTFRALEDYVRDTVTYMQSVQQDGSIVKCDGADKVEGNIAKVEAIQSILTRNHMKVAFFGRTSNGKSSVINAMFRKKILPTSAGHTTNCFVQVEGSDSGEPYLVIGDSKEKHDVKSVEQLANALCDEKLEESQLVHIYWPKDKCLLLRDDVVFIDSPGGDMTTELDKIIDRYCRDADVFVFVANGLSTLSKAEKNFFHQVSTKLAKPNIFILNNHWDRVASEPDTLDKVRAQHMERAVEFLVKDLKVCTEKEANQRIFFVSAKDALQARLQEQKGLPADSGKLVDGFPDIYSEFQDFEQKFEECISKSAVRTKFEKHSQSGKDIVSEIQQIIDSTYAQAEKLKEQKAAAKEEIREKLQLTEEQLLHLTKEMNKKIQQMVEDVKKKVSEALSEEICHLSVLVDECNLPFDIEQFNLNEYKKELHHHVVNGLGSNLCARLSTEFATDIEKSQQEMAERMSRLLPAEKKQVSPNALPQQAPFKMLYRLKCDNLCADFHEDLNFRFSFDLRSAISMLSDNENFRSSLSPTLAALFALLVAGTVATSETVAAPLIPALYGAMYLYALYEWRTSGKVKELKKQFVPHATVKLRLIVDLTSADCSKQVEQELSSAFGRLCHLVDEDVNDMKKEIETLDEKIKQLEEVAHSAEVLRNKANYITEQLKIFDDEFLKIHN